MADIQDLLIVGGGINGVSIARAAALAGHKVTLVEQGDLASATSSASTKLMHGGLRYLEHFAVKLVRESLRERAIMLKMAPHIVRPLEFLLPHQGPRPWWMVRTGLWLYDLLAMGGGLPRSNACRLGNRDLRHSGGAGFSYWDGRVDDARLVVLNAVDAAEAGATIRTGTRLLSARREGGFWQARLSASPEPVIARCLINAAGPWVDELLRGKLNVSIQKHLRLVRGSHLVTHRCLTGEQAYLFQQPDGRIVFAIPYEQRFTLIGTTDIPVTDPGDAMISEAETDYLLNAVNPFLRRPIGVEDIVHRYSGIRALYDDGSTNPSAVSRDYHLELDNRSGAKLLSVYGGKVTTARNLAQKALAKLGMNAADTANRPLPGGDIGDFNEFLATVRRRWQFLGYALAERLARAYGSRIEILIGDARSVADLGEDFGVGLTAREVDYLVRRECAKCATDIVWRRSKLGLLLTPAQIGHLQDHIEGIIP